MIGKVEELFRGKDREIRGARIQLCKNGKRSYIDRPLQALFPLDVHSETTNPPEAYREQEITDIQRDVKRPRRAAAIIADERRKLLIDQL